MDNIALEKTVNDSGFPLQMALARVAQGAPGWRVILSEHQWTDPPSDDPKFIDLVVAGESPDPVRLVVECKRSRETEWIFLREPTDYEGRDKRLEVRARVTSMTDQGGTVLNEWKDVTFLPGSPIASYCAIRKSGQSTKDLLEKPAAEVARAAEALAGQETAIRSRLNRTALRTSLQRVYVPVIVTTAKVFICDFEPENVNLETGEVSSCSPAEANMVRFRKSLASADPERSGANSVEDFARESERSVIVVQAAYFSEFLNRWKLSQGNPAYLKDALFRQ